MNPSSFKPIASTDFLGDARLYTRMIDRAVADAKATGDPLKLMFHGPPGTGKTSLAAYTVRALGASKWATTKISGVDAKIDAVDAIARDLHTTSLFGWRAIWFEEIDAMPSVAQTKALMVIDDAPRETAIIATCNSKPDRLEERFHSRFQAIAINGPKDDELRSFISARWPLPPATLAQIVTFSGGNVRQALLDVTTYLQTA